MNDHDPLFGYTKLNALGRLKANEVATAYTTLLRTLEKAFPLGGREGAIVRSKLEESSMYAKKCIALQKQFQEEETP